MKPDPKQLRLAADLIEHNHPWEYLSGLSGRWTTPSNSNPLPYLATETTQIRSIPLTGKWNPDAWEPCKKTINL